MDQRMRSATQGATVLGLAQGHVLGAPVLLLGALFVPSKEGVALCLVAGVLYLLVGTYIWWDLTRFKLRYTPPSKDNV